MANREKGYRMKHVSDVIVNNFLKTHLLCASKYAFGTNIPTVKANDVFANRTVKILCRRNILELEIPLWLWPVPNSVGQQLCGRKLPELKNMTVASFKGIIKPILIVYQDWGKETNRECKYLSTDLVDPAILTSDCGQGKAEKSYLYYYWIEHTKKKWIVPQLKANFPTIKCWIKKSKT